MSDERPIGVFDSGLGGLTVVRAIRERLPRERLVYYGDTARFPYGSKSQESVARFSWEAVRFFQSHNAKCIVIACNTASAFALPEIQGKCDMPVIGVIEPGARAAVKLTARGKIGVIGTMATINSDAYTHAIRRLKPSAVVYAQPCPLLAPLAEEGWVHKPATQLVIEEYLSPLRTARIDTLVLGCTHYPLLSGPIQAFMGDEVRLVDSASTCAAELVELLAARTLLSDAAVGDELFFVTDMAARFSEVGTRFMGRSLQAIKVVGAE